MTRPLTLGIGLLCSLAAQTAAAQDAADQPAFEFETTSVRETIEPGPNIFVNMQGWDSASSIRVYGAEDLGFKGIMSAGLQGNSAVSADGKTVYYVSGYYSRFSYGDAEHVLQIFDVDRLNPVREIELPLKVAQYTADASLLRLSADETLIYVQNSTPATSVTIVDLTTNTVVQEVPTPGCFGVYPTLEGHSFSTICSDGSFMTVALDDAGQTVDTTRSEMIFDPDADPIYLATDRYQGDLMFLSYNGNIYRAADASGTVELVTTYPMTEGTEGWLPGGYVPFTVNEANGVAFVPMHMSDEIGTHHRGSEEIWAYDIEAGTLLYRSPAANATSVFVTDDAEPVLYTLSLRDDEIARYEVDTEAKFAVKKAETNVGIGFSTVMETAALQ
ncbi:amine dehydrogenase large subunit [Pseudoroseicyclus sp. H15]